MRWPRELQVVGTDVRELHATLPPRTCSRRDDGAFYWLHVLSKQGIPMNVPGWTTLLQKLTRATLEAVSYFSLRFGK